MRKYDEDEMMDNEEFELMNLHIVNAAMVSLLIPEEKVTEYINQLKQAETFGPVFHPSEYIKAKDNLTDMLEIAESYRRFRNDCAEVQYRQEKALKKTQR